MSNLLLSQKIIARTESGDRTIMARAVDIPDPRVSAEKCRKVALGETERFMNLAIDQALLLNQSLISPKNIHIEEFLRIVEYIKTQDKSVTVTVLENDNKKTIIIQIDN